MKNPEITHITINDKTNCCGCSACASICPKSVIRMESDEEGFSYPVVNESICIECSLCRNVCPILDPPRKYKGIKTYGGFASNIDEQLTSSSGGVFALLAKQIICAGGYVCGAAFTDDFSVKHVIIHTENDLSLLKGTKYVQSDMGNCYSEIKVLLQRGNQVLFSGTPCQVAGLKSFLQKEYDNLFTVDLICHGVPSPRVWRQYLKELTNDEKILGVNFRYKDTDGIYIRITYGGQDVFEKKTENMYMQGFLKNYYVRPSCFECRFKGIQRCSDITIGDFWGITEYYPNFQNGKGTSAIIIHSNKGQMIFDDVQREMQVIEVLPKELELWNENLLVSTHNTILRDEFYLNWKKQGVTSSVKLLLEKEPKPVQHSESVISKIISRIKRIV